jgi:hypothetical protein
MFNLSLPVKLAVPPREGAFWFPDSQIWNEQQACRETTAEADVRMQDQKTA